MRAAWFWAALLLPGLLFLGNGASVGTECDAETRIWGTLDGSNSSPPSPSLLFITVRHSKHCVRAVSHAFPHADFALPADLDLMLATTDAGWDRLVQLRLDQCESTESDAL